MLPDAVAKVQRRLTARARIVVLVAIMMVTAIAAGGCGTDDAKQAADPAAHAAIKRAAAVTSKQSRGTAMTIKATMGFGDQSLSMAGDGVVDNDGRGKMQLEVSPDGEDAVTVNEILDGYVVYVSSSDLDEVLPDGKKWLKVDLQAAAESEGIDLEALSGGAPQTPEQALAYLKGAGATEELGSETINGVKTTRYRVEVDLRKVAKNGGADTEKSVEKIIELMGTDTMPMEVWIDEQDRIRRQKLDFEVTEGDQRQSVEMTIDLTDFNVPVRVSLPDEDETIDALDVLEDE